MMATDYTHRHGTYEVANHFYTEMIPELEEIAEKAIKGDDPEKQKKACLRRFHYGGA